MAPHLAPASLVGGGVLCRAGGWLAGWLAGLPMGWIDLIQQQPHTKYIRSTSYFILARRTREPEEKGKRPSRDDEVTFHGSLLGPEKGLGVVYMY